MIKGLNHFEKRKKNIVEAISQFELENDIKFPKLFKLFIKSFEAKIKLPLVDDPEYGLRS